MPIRRRLDSPHLLLIFRIVNKSGDVRIGTRTDSGSHAFRCFFFFLNKDSIFGPTTNPGMFGFGAERTNFWPNVFRSLFRFSGFAGFPEK